MDYPRSVAGINLYGGKFTDGDPSRGIPASLDTAKFDNSVADELLAIIAAKPGLAASETDNTQVLQAIQYLIGLVSWPTLPGKPSPFIADQVPASGVLLPPWLTTAAGDSRYFGTGVLAANGYWLHPGGLIEQWGVGGVTGNLGDTNTYYFPISFPHASFIINPSVLNPNNVANVDYSLQVISQATNYFTTYNQFIAGGTDFSFGSRSMVWRAIGW